MFKRIAIPVGLLLLAVGVFGVLKLLKPEVPLMDVQEKKWPVQVQKLERVTLRPSFTVYGEIVAARRTQIRSQVTGAISTLNPDFNDGAFVPKDTVLIEIDSFDYLNALNERQADVAEARATLEELQLNKAGEEALLPQDKELVSLAQREVARQKKLLKSSAGRQKTYDDALSALNERRQNVLKREQTLNRLTAQINKAEAALERAKSRERTAERDLEDTKITAPYDGFLVQTQAALGQAVGTTDQLGELIALDHLEAALKVSEADYSVLSKDPDLFQQTITLRWGKRTQDQASATLTRSAGQIDATSGGRTLYARLDKLTAQTPLRPGLFVSARLEGPAYENVFSVPQSAIFQGNTLFAVKDQRLIAHTVTPIARFNDRVIMKDTLALGTEIVITRFPELGEGVMVEVKP